MKVKFWGSRGSIPVPDGRMIKYGGNTTCVEVEMGDRLMIIDAGTGIRKLGEDILGRQLSDVDMFITHSHWDHIQGFPFFTPVYAKETKINIFGSPLSYKQIKDSLANQMSQEYFPVRFSDLKSKINFIELHEGRTEMNDYVYKIMQVNHTITTLSIRIEKGDRSFVFMTDNELGSEKPVTTYDKFVDFCSGATYLIHDAQFTTEEYQHRKGWGHSSYEEVMKLGKDAGVSNVGFFHHDPDRKDNELAVIERKFKEKCEDEKCGFGVFAVREQDEIEI